MIYEIITEPDALPLPGRFAMRGDLLRLVRDIHGEDGETVAYPAGSEWSILTVEDDDAMLGRVDAGASAPTDLDDSADVLVVTMDGGLDAFEVVQRGGDDPELLDRVSRARQRILGDPADLSGIEGVDPFTPGAAL